MNKLFNTKTYFTPTPKILVWGLLLAFGAMLLPCSVFAASVHLETARTGFFVGDTILIDVKVDSGGKEINTVEGRVLLDYSPGTVLVKDINLSGSSFSLWPNKPTLSEDLRTVSFVGGVPGGLTSQNATLFKIALNLKNAGQITLIPTTISIYLNDGKGTREIANVQSLTINVLPQEVGHKPVNDLNTLIVEDKTPPEPFKIVVGQDDSVFEGKKFLSFNTIDEGSGIRYYEVWEGGLAPVRSSGTYILENQDKRTKVVVVAYDAAGNARESVYDPKSYLSLVVIVVLTLLLITALGFVVKKRKKNVSIKK